jgi:hypothetical protein
LAALARFAGVTRAWCLARGSEHSMKTGQIHSRLRHQGGEPGDEVRRLEDDLRGAVAAMRL